MAQHGTAQHGTAQHGTAQRTTAQAEQSTAQHKHSTAQQVTSETYSPFPPSWSSTAISSLAQNMCWWCCAFTPSITNVPYSGLSSPKLRGLVDSSPVSLISYLMVPSCNTGPCRCHASVACFLALSFQQIAFTPVGATTKLPGNTLCLKQKSWIISWSSKFQLDRMALMICKHMAVLFFLFLHLSCKVCWEKSFPVVEHEPHTCCFCFTDIQQTELSAKNCKALYTQACSRGY